MKRYQYYVVWSSENTFGKSKIVLDTPITNLKHMEGLELLIKREGLLSDDTKITILNYFEFVVVEEKELMGPR